MIFPRRCRNSAFQDLKPATAGASARHADRKRSKEDKRRAWCFARPTKWRCNIASREFEASCHRSVLPRWGDPRTGRLPEGDLRLILVRAKSRPLQPLGGGTKDPMRPRMRGQRSLIAEPASGAFFLMMAHARLRRSPKNASNSARPTVMTRPSGREPPHPRHRPRRPGRVPRLGADAIQHY